MARLRRLDIALVPQHVIVRGVNRQPCFYQSGDFASYLDDLARAIRSHACAVHAYVLMTNHVHLLVTGREPGSISAMMQCTGRRYVKRFNASWGRTGTLYQGRFRSSPVETERYLLTCMRYIEQNPVRAGMVATPFEYRWSSVHANAGLRLDSIVTPHAEYQALGRTDHQRAAAYRLMLGNPLGRSIVDSIRQHVNAGCALGGPAFQSAVARSCGRRAHPCRSGPRPKAATSARPASMDERW